MQQFKTIVTGGAGFIGSHLVDRLLTDGHEVTVIDNLSSGNKKNIEHNEDNKNFNFLHADIINKEEISEFFSKIDWVFHLAALADIVPSIQHPDDYFNSNVRGTFSVLESSREHHVKRFIYAASSSCYGIPDEYPTPEDAEIRTEYPYALTKFLGEKMVMHWGKIYQLPVISLRFFNVYGPRSRTSGTYGAVFGVFLSQKIHKKPFTVVGDGTQTRDFTFVTDVVDACIKAADSEVINEILNVGSNNTYSVNYLTELLSGDIVHIPKRPGEPNCTFADINKIKTLLNWEPNVSFEEGVSKMLESLEDWQEAPLWTPGAIEVATKDWFKFLSK
jgi:UDP-glucose 4-epimerase